MGGLAESGVRATCFGGFTIVYIHRSTDRPVPYTDSRTSRAHEVIARAKQLRPDRKEEGERRKEEEEKKTKRRKRRENEGGTIRGGDQRTAKAGEQTEVHFHSLRQGHSYYNDGRTAYRCSLACPLSCQTLRPTGFSPSPRCGRRRRTHLSHLLTSVCKTAHPSGRGAKRYRREKVRTAR